MNSKRRDYRLHELTWQEFEALCSGICIEWLGEGFTPFADGIDGGRDGKFVGTANCFPDVNQPISGSVAIQAKHSATPGASCTDSDFKTKMKAENKKVKRLVDEGICEHYLLFTNRRYSGGTDEELYKSLMASGVTSAHIIGNERLKLALDSNAPLRNTLPNRYDDQPFTFNEQDITAVVEAFHTATSTGAVSDFHSAQDFEKTPLSEKNELNNLSKKYYEHVIRPDSMPHFNKIRKFLENPRNKGFADLYHDAADELKRKLIVEGDSFDSFDKALTFVIERVQHSDERLSGKRRLASVFVHYMYADCDIGLKTKAELDATC